MKKSRLKGFTLIEILIVLSIIGILGSVVIGSVNTAQEKTYYAKSKLQFKSFVESLQLFVIDKGGYPSDANRNIPAGLEEYLTSDSWPSGPWPESIYDWENWNDPNNPGKKIYQISVRFCPVGGSLGQCRFPKQDWAQNFGINSAVYYCIEGACRSHINENINYPGHCVNCQD